METKRLKISELEPNLGQIDGLPINPRQWTKTDVDNIAASLKETPELFEARPLIVTPHAGKYIILGGNLRFEGVKKNKDKDAPCIIVPEDTPIGKLKEIVIKDNSSFGAWDYDALANEWDDLPLQDWGVPAWETDETEIGPTKKEMTQTELLSGIEYNGVYYEPDEVPHLELQDCINTDKFDAKVAALDEYDLTPEQKETLRLFAYRFIRIDFEAVANYYAFNATDEERKAIERLRLVLSDNGLNGFIEDKLLRVAKVAEDAAREG